MSIVKIAAMSAVLIIVSLSTARGSDESHTTSIEKEVLTVYKSPTCGCCGAWVKHANTEGLATIVSNVEDMRSVKNRLGIQPQHRACHTAVSAEGYIFEGHIPAKAIQSFLANKPINAVGLAVPGMPMGSPGMEQNDAFSPYQIVQIMKDGSTVPYQMISNQKEQYK